MGVKVKIKKLHPDAVIPKLATAGSACVDVVATKVYLLSENKAVVHLGFALEIPVGYKVCLAPRSSFTKTNWVMQNSPAQIDSDYRGEVMLRFTAIPTEVTIMDEDELEDARNKFLGADEEQRAELEFEQDFLSHINGNGEDDDDEEIFDDSDLLSEYVGFLEYDEFPYKEGDRCAQMWIEKVQRIEFEEADELEDTERGEGGFGSTGN